jgi:hypothetical protein
LRVLDLPPLPVIIFLTISYKEEIFIMFAKMRIGTKLFLVTILSAVMPVVTIAIVVGIYISSSIDSITTSIKTTREQMASDIIGKNLKDEAAVTAQQVDQFVSERIYEVTGWAASPVIRKAARDASSTAVEKGLVSLTEKEQETKMNDTRALSEDPEVFNYLKELVKLSPAFSEVFFTDDHGFAVAHSNMTSDFVQKGEDWWDQTWATGSYVGQVGFDESSGVYSVDTAVRITDEAGKPVGGGESSFKY